jgi:fibronectin type III domain-containing protein 3
VTTNNQVHSQTTRNNKNDNLNGSSVARRTLQRTNGTSSTGGASSVGTSDDGEESSSVPDEEDDFHHIINYLSSVEAPQVKDIQSHTALITWEAPPAPTENALNNLNTNDIRYEILLGDRGKDGKYKSIFRGTNLSCRIQDLRAGQDYHVCLAAHLDDVHGETTDPVLFKTPPREPDAPLMPKVILKTKNSLQLRWNAPVDNGSHIIHYILEMSSEVEREFTELCKIKSKQFTVSKLMPATWYTFRMAAVNECGRSEYSEPVAYITDGYPPPQPMQPKVHNITTSSITLLWHRRREDGDFILQMTSQGAQGYMNVYYGPEIIYECVRLQRATAYQFRLGSKTDSGSSPWSDEITVTTLPDQPGRPSKPQVKGKIHAYHFKVKWDPPLDRGGADIKLYHLEISSGAIFERVYSGIHTEAQCERLTPGTTYQVRVLCEGPGGCSQASDPCTVTTEAIAPNPPQTPYYSNTPGPYAAVLQWEKPHELGGAPITEYELELEGILNDGAEKTKQRVVAYRGKESYCVVKDLLPGESYTTRVRAVNRIGAGEWSEDFCFRAASAPPSKPSPPEVHVRSATNLLVQWREPQCNGAPILDYKLESSVREEDAFNVVYHGPETSADLKDLLPFTTYFFRFHAVNAAGRSPNTTTVCQKTPAAVPNVPTLLPELFAITSSTAHIYWKEPECNGDAIVSYLLECGDRQLSTDASRTDLLVEQLNPEQVYKVKVQAVNRIGAGAFTQSHKITTKPLPPKAPRLECIQYGYNSLKLKWGSDVAASKSANVIDFQRFEVDMKIKSSSKDFQNIYAGTRNSIKVQKLHESTVYAFRICSQTEHAGVGAWSDEYLFKTQAAQPNTVKINKCIENYPVITSGSGESHVDALPSLTVEWQNSKNNHFNDAIEYILQKALAAGGNSKNLSFDEVKKMKILEFTKFHLNFQILDLSWR